MEQLIKQLNSEVKIIQKIYNQIKKDSAPRKTQAYGEARLLTINNAWTEIEKFNEQIEAVKESNPQHKYFTEKYFDQIEALYDDTRERVESIIRDDIERRKNSEAIAEQLRMIKKQNALIDTLRRCITTIENELKSPTSKTYLTQKIKLLGDYWEHILMNHGEIMSRGKFKDEYFDEDIFAKVEDIYQTMIIKLQEELEMQTTSQYQQHLTSGSTNNTENNHTKVKLPRIDIPNFNGDYLKWQSFCDLFTELIHKDKKMANAEKLFYLKANLSGEPHELIQHLQATNENYETAWNILNKRYNNKRTLVSTQLRTLINQATLIKETAEGVKKLHDTTNECLQAIRNLGINIDNWDPIIIYIISQKMDKESRRIYEQSLKNPREIQTLQEFFDFLENRFQGLEAIDSSQQAQFNRNPEKKKTDLKVHHGTVGTASCVICKANHKIYSCERFSKLTAYQKNDAVRKHKLCVNCLSKGHSAGACKSWRGCKICNKRHHTLLHQDLPNQKISFNQNMKVNEGKSQPDKNEGPKSAQVTTHMAESHTRSTVLLATAIIKVIIKNGAAVELRALIDQGAQASFITQEAAQRLKAHQKRTHAVVSGVGETNIGVVQTYIDLTIMPRFQSSFSLTTTALVLKKLTKVLPTDQIVKSTWNHTKNLRLADPKFDSPQKIDIILGADVFGKILLENVLRGPPGSPVAQQTELGWILSGEVQNSSSQNRIQCCISEVNISEDLRRFWETEELKNQAIVTSEDMACEKHFRQSHNRRPDGRYTVRIPFRANPNEMEELSDTRQLALARLFQMERKFKKDPTFAALYKNFMHEYQTLGHMVPASDNLDKRYYLPHHAVLKHDSSTTKLRVVFDASAKQCNSKSLNDLMMVGPQLQQNLISILLRWRKHKIVFMADIEKMYRQINIDIRDQNFQRILWRNNPEEPIREYNLTTVTYGTAAAPFLAIRTLRQLAQDEQLKFPIAAKIILEDTYVDDVVSGGNSLEEANESSTQLRKMLESGGFNLRKWTSNEQQLLRNIPWSLRENANNIDFDHDKIIKALGVHWHPNNDSFKILTNVNSEKPTTSKRDLLSEAARIFDPIGFLAPVTIKVKILLQEIWMHGCEWDDPIPNEILQVWNRIKCELPTLQKIEIPRWISYTGTNSQCELHGFSDASEKAFSAAVYFRIKQREHITTHLLTAKTKVAPLKSKLSLPRLELSGATLLANLLKEAKDSLAIDDIPIYAWTDSTIVLAWLKEDPHKWKTFVGNRVAEIQSIIGYDKWYHVKSRENPADIASRGIYPSFLRSHKVWWEGPSWLKEQIISVPQEKPFNTDLERKKLSVNTITQEPQNDNVIGDLLQRYSSLGKTQRVLAYCHRFIQNIKPKSGNKLTSPLSTEELNKALHQLIKYSQRRYFTDEIEELSKGQELHKGSKLLSLNPFLDHEQILRVGGRLERSEMPYNRKHPIILPHKGEITSLVIDHAHKTALHGGNTLTLEVTRQNYWILNGLKAVKGHIHKCTKCYRYKAKMSQQLMGMLPKERVLTSPPFSHCGVDYAGPIDLLLAKGRGNRTYKGYLSIFVCLTTKAIHIEVVTDLTSRAFIAAFKRFVSRRGPVAHIYSDNATNFVGANKILNAGHSKERYKSEIIEALHSIGTQWHFIPPASPHFGGLWEAGVKSIKHHMRRVIGETKLTYEEMCTLMSQIEACLNSRPLCPISEDPESLEVLTPGHFLTGAPLLAVPQNHYLDTNPNLLNKWDRIERMHQEFWRKWATEYIGRLQQRPKWTQKHTDIKKGNLVLLKEEQLPPSKWALARVINTHPGSDGLTRVVTLRTKNGTFKRPITKIALLPISDNRTENKSNPEEEFDEDKTSDQPATQDKICLHISVDNGRKRAKETIHPEHTKRCKQDRCKNTTRNTGPKGNGFLYFCILSLFFIITLGQEAEVKLPYKITQFHKKEGIYYEDVAQLQLCTSEWNLLIFYDLSTYWREYIGLRHAIKGLTELCENVEQSSTSGELCTATLRQIRHQITEADHINEVLYQQNENSNRYKRAPLEIVGTISNKLFGILDQDFAEKYEQQIAALKENEHLLHELLKNQTSIAESTVNVYKKDHQMVQHQLMDLEDQIATIAHYANNTTNELMTIQTFNSAAILITLNLITLLQVQRALLEVITDTKHGRINTLLLTPTQLKEQLKVIREHLPHNLKLPGDGSTKSLLSIYESMGVKVRITRKNVLFDVRIPLLNIESYTLFKMIPIPTLHDGKHIYIETSSTYVAINRQRDRFSPITKDDLRMCFHTAETELICSLKQPIFTLKSTQNQCEIELFSNRDSISALCKLKSTNPKKSWIKLTTPSSWIYIMDEDTNYDVICQNQMYHVMLEGNGIIELQPNCQIMHQTLYISSDNKITDRIQASFIPETQVISSHLNLKKTNSTGNWSIPQLTRDVTSNDFLELDAIIKNHQQQLEEMPKLTNHDLHHYSSIYVLLAIIIAIGLYYLYQRRRKRQNLTRGILKIGHPKPKPRTLNIPLRTISSSPELPDLHLDGEECTQYI